MTDEVQETQGEHVSGNSDNVVQEQHVVEPSINELEQRIAALELEAEEHKNNWLRTMADFKNYKRRTETEREELMRNAGAGLILKLLPVLDDLGRAMNHIPAEIDNNPWMNGVKQVQRKFELVLEGAGVQVIPAVGEEFDPNVHEAVMYDEVGDDQANKVVEELQRGYKLGERVLRPTMVKVGK